MGERAVRVVHEAAHPTQRADRLGALGEQPDHGVFDHRCTTDLRLLGLRPEVLRGDLPTAGRGRTRRLGGPQCRRSRSRLPGPGSRTRSRCLRADGRDVPRRRGAGSAGLSADARPTQPVRLRPQAVDTARRRHSHRRLRVHHPQPAVVPPVRTGGRSCSDAISRVRPLGGRARGRRGRRRHPRLGVQGARGP